MPVLPPRQASSLKCVACGSPASGKLECPDCAETHKELAAHGKQFPRAPFCSAKCYKANQGSHQAAHVYRVRHFRSPDGNMLHRRMTDEEWAQHQRQRDGGAGDAPAPSADTTPAPASVGDASSATGGDGEAPTVREMRKSLEELRIKSAAEAVQLLKVSHDVNEIVAANDFLVAAAKAASASAHATQHTSASGAPTPSVASNACTVYSNLLDGDVAGAWFQILSASRTLFDSTGKTFDQVPTTHAKESSDAAWHTIFAPFARQAVPHSDPRAGSHATSGSHGTAASSKPPSSTTGTGHRPTSGGTHRPTSGGTSRSGGTVGAGAHGTGGGGAGAQYTGSSGGSLARTTSGGTSGTAPRRQSSIGKSVPGKQGTDETKRNDADVLLPTIHVASLVVLMPALAKMKGDPQSIGSLNPEDEEQLVKGLHAVLEPRMPMSEVHPPPRVRDWIESDDATKGAQALRRVAKHALAAGDASATVTLLMGAALMDGEDAGADLKKTVRIWRDECNTYFEARHDV